MNLKVPLLTDAGMAWVKVGNSPEMDSDLSNLGEPCYVFAGPTVSRDEIESELPGARVLPPVAAGDLMALSRLNPAKVVLIDGYFERRPAVWHKEILYLMAQGTKVFGAASMGALRAYELHAHGMIGVGAVFESYRLGLIDGDDEVALVHGEPGAGYQGFTVPLVNLRYHLGAMVERGELNLREAMAKLDALKKIPYFDRRPEICQDLMANDKGRLLDLKHRDALMGLRAAKEDLGVTREGQVFHPTALLWNLSRDVACEPFPGIYEWLPAEEHAAVTWDMNASDSLRKAARVLARLLCLCDQLGWDSRRIQLSSEHVAAYAKAFGVELPSGGPGKVIEIIAGLAFQLSEACREMGYEAPQEEVRRRTELLVERGLIGPSFATNETLRVAVAAYVCFLNLGLYSDMECLPLQLRIFRKFYFGEALHLMNGPLLSKDHADESWRFEAEHFLGSQREP